MHILCKCWLLGVTFVDVYICQYHVSEEEQEQDLFSPQIDVVLDEPKAKEESVCSGGSLNVSGEYHT